MSLLQQGFDRHMEVTDSWQLTQRNELQHGKLESQRCHLQALSSSQKCIKAGDAPAVLERHYPKSPQHLNWRKWSQAGEDSQTTSKHFWEEAPEATLLSAASFCKLIWVILIVQIPPQTIYASGSCNSPEKINGGGKNQRKKPKEKASLKGDALGETQFQQGILVGPALYSKYVVPDLHICTPKTDAPNTPKRTSFKLESFKRSHQYCLKDMKKEGKIKIKGRDFILVPKRDFLNLVQSLCISVVNTRKMLILQVATTLLVEEISAGLYHPHIRNSNSSKHWLGWKASHSL